MSNSRTFEEVVEVVNKIVMLVLYITGVFAFAFPNYVGFQTGVLALLIVIAERSFKRMTEA